uniref:Chemosensory protein 7 n=1 Tax=Mythimna separata TaxID=271217 RepID=A0A1V1WC03_MYTSE|nr:chemosensory protein 7 [Mythimna separata]
MKTLFILCALVIAVSARPEEQYTTEYDNIDIDEILNNDRLFKSYFECLVGEGKCTPAGKELKSHMPDALQTECSKCSPKQKEGTKKVMKFLINNKPEQWKRLCAKYDPEGKYASKYEKELKEVSQ